MNFLRKLFGQEQPIVTQSSDAGAKNPVEIRAQVLALYLFNSTKISNELDTAFYGKYAEGELLKAISEKLKPDGGWQALPALVQVCRGDIFGESTFGEIPGIKMLENWLKNGTYGLDPTNLDSIALTQFRSGQKLDYVPYITGLAPLQKSYAVHTHEELKARSVVGYIGLIILNNAPSLAKIAKELNLPLRFEIKKSRYSGELLASSEAIREAGLEQTIESLLAKLNDTDEWASVRQEAAEALGNSRDIRAVEPLIRALRDDYIPLRKSAVTALGKIGDARAIGPLTTVLKDSDVEVQQATVEALKKLGQLT